LRELGRILLAKRIFQDLSKRERQILRIIYDLGQASASDVIDRIPDGPGYSTIRKLLSILEQKGLVRHTEKDRRYIYHPVLSKSRAQSSALRDLMKSLFENSASAVITTLMDISAPNISDEDLRKMAALIERHRKEREKNDVD
jgi:predicted transcriptional regulator